MDNMKDSSKASSEFCLDPVVIKKRKAVLKKAGKELKKHFIGIDNIIDRILSLMESWYVLPEIITRPVIINLWGLTGVGKTDLIRKLVRLINYYDKYVELQMDDTSTGNSLKGLLLSSDIPEGEPGIVLLDEMQRFRTKNEDGTSKTISSRLNDTWTLLSDGKFTHDFGAKSSAQESLMDELYWDDYHKASALKEIKDDDDDDEKTKENEKKKKYEKANPEYQRKFHMSFWSAKSVKRMLRSTDTPEEIMKWTSTRKSLEVQKYLSNPDSIREFDFHKLLVFVCGNLDEAYSMSSETAETNTDADILHEFSKKIDFLRIKKALNLRFFPEQIARFGNLHVIYPSLNKDSYQKIIHSYIQKVTDRIYTVTNGIKINVDQSIYDAIYRNGVFPAQGVRPVLTTVSGTFECMLPIFLQKAIETNTKEFNISTDGIRLFAKINGKGIQSEKIYYEIDKIKKTIDKQVIYRNSIHESGHVVVYSVLNKVVPTELKSNLAGNEGAYTLTHRISLTKEGISKYLQILFGGLVAEHLIFGEGLQSEGNVHDIMEATYNASNYVRIHGFGKVAGRLAYPHNDQNTRFIGDDGIYSGSEINSLLEEAKAQTKELLLENIDFLKELSNEIKDKTTMNAKEIQNIAKKYVKDVKVLEAGKSLYENYEDKFKSFVNSTNGDFIHKNEVVKNNG